MQSCVFAPLFLQRHSYSLSQNCWDTLLSSCPPKVGVKDLLTFTALNNIGRERRRHEREEKK